MKLDLELLAPYLPYGLKFFIPHDDYQEIQTLTGLSKEDGIQTDYDKVDEQGTVGNLWSFTGERNYEFYRIKPILRPLEDLDDEEDNTPEELIRCCWNYTQGLIAKHYDVFGLIEKNLAIDKNTLDDKIEK